MEPAEATPGGEDVARWATVRAKIQALESPPLDTDDAQALVQDLETAYEELRVADEEVRVQQDQITQLIEGQHVLRWQHERMMAVLPMPVIGTDAQGVIRSVNAAAATLVERRAGRLLGKPLLALVAPEDRSDLRRLLGRLVREGTGFRRVVTLLGAARRSISAEISVSRLPGPSPEITWMLLVGADTERSDSHRGRELPEALSRLALIPTQVSEEHEALARAAGVCRECLGTGVAVSLSKGPPDQPAVLSSTSQLAQMFDGAQMAAGEGPCVTAFEEKVLVESRDVQRDQRWPSLTEYAPGAVSGVVAAPLEVGEDVVGTLTVYVVEPTWPARLREDVEMLAATVAAVLFELGLKRELQDLATDLEQALTSRATIDQAKGIVMADRGVDAETAFEHLAQLSSTRHVKLRDLAQEIVDGASHQE